MKIIYALLILFAISFPLNNNAEDLIVGTITCKEWVEDRATDRNYINKSVDQSWVMGFLSAYAVAVQEDFLVNIKPQTIYKWMDQYCASHPSSKIEDGTLILAHQLVQQMKK